MPARKAARKALSIASSRYGSCRSPVPYKRSIPPVTTITARLAAVVGQRLTRSVSERYGLALTPLIPGGNRNAFARRRVIARQILDNLSNPVTHIGHTNCRRVRL